MAQSAESTAVIDNESQHQVFEQDCSHEGRTLPACIEIPSIRGEMVYLRPACLDDLPLMDDIEAYIDASAITGKDRIAERAAVHAWVKRSLKWQHKREVDDVAIEDPELRRTIAWSVMTGSEYADNGDDADSSGASKFIGMIFLIDIDGWAKSARIQVILGKEFRGRGYSRDAMPRVMTYGFATEPQGLGLHRIWVSVPEKNLRSISVYQSLGFVPAGTARDALWDARNNKYQDQIIMETLVDEYDPINSLDAFGMHAIAGNPGMEEAMAAHEHTLEIRKRERAGEVIDDEDGRNGVSVRDGVRVLDPSTISGRAASHGSNLGRIHGADNLAILDSEAADTDVIQLTDEQLDDLTRWSKRTGAGATDRPRESTHDDGDGHNGAENMWPYNQPKRKSSKKAWWRTLGHGRTERRASAIDDSRDDGSGENEGNNER